MLIHVQSMTPIHGRAIATAAPSRTMVTTTTSRIACPASRCLWCRRDHVGRGHIALDVSELARSFFCNRVDEPHVDVDTGAEALPESTHDCGRMKRARE